MMHSSLLELKLLVPLESFSNDGCGPEKPSRSKRLFSSRFLATAPISGFNDRLRLQSAGLVPETMPDQRPGDVFYIEHNPLS